MSGEVKSRSYLSIDKGNLHWRSSRSEFTADVDAAEPGGPSPGTVLATTSGVNVDLSKLTNPSLCEIENNSPTTGNYVTVGIWDGTELYPIMEILPGEKYVIRLSRFLGQSLEAGAGTGTADSGTYTLRLKAALATARCNVHAFDR